MALDCRMFHVKHSAIDLERFFLSHTSFTWKFYFWLAGFFKANNPTAIITKFDRSIRCKLHT